MYQLIYTMLLKLLGELIKRGK